MIHDEGPRINWRLAVVRNLRMGGDGLVRAADIQTSTGRTNRPITKLYPLEVTTEVSSDQLQDTAQGGEGTLVTPSTSEHRPQRASA